MRSINGYKLFALLSVIGAVFLYWILFQDGNDLCQHLATANVPATTKQVIFVQPLQGVSAQSYEPMRIPLYKIGAVVNYNTSPIVPGAGSAIFLHLWRSASHGTAGCIAMSEGHLLPLLQWLDKKHHPYIYITDLHYKE